MSRHEAEAIVLRCVEVGEADYIVHLLTPEWGHIPAMAKHARKSRKRFPGTLDLLNHLRIEVQRRADRMDYLGKAELVSPFLALREQPRRFALACQLAEMLGRMAPEAGDPADARRLFDFTVSAFRVLETTVPDARLRVFLTLSTLAALGLQPQLEGCVRCGREAEGTGPVGFHVGDGGFLCRSCQGPQEELLPVHVATLAALRQGLRLDLGKLDRLVLGTRELVEAELLVQRFQRFHTGIELRSEAFVREAFVGVARSPAEGNTPPPRQHPGARDF
jgi:DNA repair protein RecO (recombination protein O)